ncbi:hypothetical protein MPTK1_3g18950 [Marchantia polymorpha subsp. ruderalis]|nr:hypothetical protein MARPO_0369s0002 [Marchantia polymorpha]BBN06167.1 hypothetical protein Mp_3g18950 [Marchantia polymorpha subsp. ruderalis]|eukprot:PTQ26790.1 hypothetical protein MARPO_0369s0002 [Marchantia polymorpha]
MYKNQLQELAQRSCFNLPAYACIREGPDHAPRFKATVNFNGEIFESPNYCSTLRQAEHAAAEVALNTLSRRGPSQSLAMRILDETGVCKNLLQETAQRAGVSLPVYTTTRSGPGHLPVFTCQVELAGMKFDGEAAKTKKQAEKNAAMAAWSALKQFAVQFMSTSTVPESEVTEEQEQNTIARALASVSGKDEKPMSQPSVLPQSTSSQGPAPSGRVRLVNVRERGAGQVGVGVGVGGGSSGPSAGQYHSGSWIPMDMPQQQESIQGPRYMHNHPSVLLKSDHPYRAMVAPRTHSSTSSPVRESPVGLSREALAASRAASNIVNVRRVNMSPTVTMTRRRDPHEVPLPLDEHQRDEEEWLRGDTPKPKQQSDASDSGVGDSSDKDRSGPMAHSSYNPMMWSSSSPQWWNLQSSHGASMPSHRRFATGSGLAPPVRVRQLLTVSAAPPPPRREPEDSENDSTEGEAATRQVLSQLSL